MLGYLGKLIVAKGFKKLPKVQKSPDLVTLAGNKNRMRTVRNVSCKLHTYFKNNMGQFRPLFLLFSSFSHSNIKQVSSNLTLCIEKGVDGVLGIQTRGRRIVGADEPLSYGRWPLFSNVLVMIYAHSLSILFTFGCRKNDGMENYDS